MKEWYKIKECESCGDKNILKKGVTVKENSEVFIECPSCGHAIKYNHSKEIHKNVVSSFMLDSMSKHIFNLTLSNNIHYLVGSDKKDLFIQGLKDENPDNLKSVSLELIFKFLNGEKSDSFKDIDIPLVPNYSNGVVSGLGVVEFSYDAWFFKVLNTGINPFTSEACLMEDAFYKYITVVRNDQTYIDWNKLWKYIDKKIGLRNYRDVLESRKRKSDAAKEFYYTFAMENDLQRDFKEVMSTAHENLSIDEKRYCSYFNMHKESDEYQERITPERDFWLECLLLKPFKDDGRWLESYFDLKNWDKCYWGHVIILDRLTKGHPARNNGIVYFKIY